MKKEIIKIIFVFMGLALVVFGMSENNWKMSVVGLLILIETSIYK